MEVSVLNIKGAETGRKVSLNDAIYAIEPNDHALYLDVKLSSLTGTKVYRNDQLVYTSTETTQGKSVAWTDRPSTDGYYI